LNFMKDLFHHENTKSKKHEIYMIFLLRVFILSCFRD
jgi:hypothetical protein